MQPHDFTDDAPGRLAEIKLAGEQGVHGFIPNPLGPDLKLSMATIRLMSRAENLLGRLDGMTDALPDPSILVRAFVRREAAVSSYIEDTFAAYEDIGLVERNRDPAQRQPQAREVYNAELVIGYAIDAIRLHGRSISVPLLREMHHLLLHDIDTDAETVGDFRKKQVFIGKRSLGHQHARFVPPPSIFVPELIDQFCTYLSNQQSDPPLIASAIAHYQFETIHPFEDGNGRLGRALILVKLCQDGCLRRPVLNPSLFFELHREEYYDSLLVVSQTGAWSVWIDFFLRGMVYAAEDAIERVQAMRTLMQKYREMLHQARASMLLQGLIDQLFVYPRITISMAAEIMGITKEAARKNVDRLVEAGVLAEVTGQPTNRVFVAKEILATVRVTPTVRGR